MAIPTPKRDLTLLGTGRGCWTLSREEPIRSQGALYSSLLKPEMLLPVIETHRNWNGVSPL